MIRPNIQAFTSFNKVITPLQMGCMYLFPTVISLVRDMLMLQTFDGCRLHRYSHFPA